MITVIIDGNELNIGGRVEEAVRYLAGKADLIDVMQQGSVRLDFAGKKFKPSMNIVSKEIEIPE